MKFSLSKKNDFKDPQTLAAAIEKSLGEISEVLQNAQAEKADLHSLLATAANERSQILTERQSLEGMRQGIGDINKEFLSLKATIDQAVAQSAKIESCSATMSALEKNLASMEKTFNRMEEKENFLDTLNNKIDLVLDKINSGKNGAGLLQDALKNMAQIEERQTKSAEAVDALEKKARDFSSEMGTAAKHELSHRGRAFRALADALAALTNP